MFRKCLHGMASFTDEPSGRLPSRKSRRKSSSVHVLVGPAGVKFAAGGHSGGPFAILPPFSLSPWQPLQDTLPTYAPYPDIGAFTTDRTCTHSRSTCSAPT